MSEPASIDTSGRGTLLGEARFLLTLTALTATVVLEFLAYIACFFVFVVVGPIYRARVRRIVLAAPAPLAGGLAGVVVLGAALLLGGCGSPKPMGIDEPMGNGESFKGQMQELRWSARALADQSYSKKSLEEDLQTFGEDPHWKEDLRFDVQNLFLMPDAKKSLEEDLQTLGDPDHKKHGLRETFQLLGW